MAINLTDKLYANTGSQVIADAIQVAGGYMSITSAQRNELTDAQKVIGTLVFETDTNKTYRYTGSDWQEVTIENIDQRLTSAEDKIDALNSATTFAGTGTYNEMLALVDVKAGSIFVVVDKTEEHKQYDNKEFVYDGEDWVELGDTTAELAEINKLNESIAVINGTGVGSIAKALVDAKAYTDDAIETVDSLNNGTHNVTLHDNGSLTINEGVATGNSSFAAGTGNKEVLEGIVGNTIPNPVKAPEANDHLTLAFGIDTIAETVGATAMGVANMAGAKGYYWHTIDFTNKTITLSTKQPTTLSNNIEAPSGDIGWKVGDVVCIRNKSRSYPYCAKITNVSGNTLTVDNLPFETDEYVTTLFGKIVYPASYEAPYDRTIYAVYQEEYQKKGSIIINRWKCRGGTVDLGFGAMATGMQNAATGIFSEASGRENLAVGDYSHAEGRVTIAGGEASHAEGQRTLAKGYASHAEGTADATAGDIVLASGDGAHAEGYAGEATGDYSHKEGYKGTASGSASHAEGGITTAIGNSSHAEGQYAVASGFASHAEGGGANAATDADELLGTWKFNDHIIAPSDRVNISMEFTNNASNSYTSLSIYKRITDDLTVVYFTNTKDAFFSEIVYSEESGWNSVNQEILITKAPNTEEEIAWLKEYATQLTIGYDSNNPTTASGDFSHAEGRNTFASAIAAHAEGARTQATNGAAHAEGADTVASGGRSHAEGDHTTASGIYSHAEGNRTEASGTAAHAEGSQTKASGARSHAEGYGTTAAGDYSHAEGGYNIASVQFAHAEGNYTTASGVASHAEGYGTTASSERAHTEGDNTTASGVASHAEGVKSTATKQAAHAEGQETEASGRAAHAEGYQTHATGARSHAEGYNTTAENAYSHAEGNSTIASGQSSHAEGARTQATDSAAHAEGGDTIASGFYAHAEGDTTVASGHASHAEGGGVPTNITIDPSEESCWLLREDLIYPTSSSLAIHLVLYNGPEVINIYTVESDIDGDKSVKLYGRVRQYSSHVEPPVLIHTKINESGELINKWNEDSNRFVKLSSPSGQAHSSEAIEWIQANVVTGNTAKGSYSHAEGAGVLAEGVGSHASGTRTIAKGNYSYTGGIGTYATGEGSRSVGVYTRAGGKGSHAEGYTSHATGNYSHSEGCYTTASNAYAHAEGWQTAASGIGSHAEGFWTVAKGEYSHAEGNQSTATGNYSHAEGHFTNANGQYSHTGGVHTTVPDTNTNGCTIFGCYGTAEDDDLFAVANGANNARSLAFQVKKTGETVCNSIILKSSTEGSDKKFKLSIDDNGVISVEAVTTISFFTLKIVVGTEDSGEPPIILQRPFDIGMTWGDYMISNYNVDNVVETTPHLTGDFVIASRNGQPIYIDNNGILIRPETIIVPEATYTAG